MGESRAALLLAVVWWTTVIAAEHLAGRPGRRRFGGDVLVVFAGITPINGAWCVAPAARSKRVPG